MSKLKLYLYIGHPYDLTFFSRLEEALRLKERFDVTALVCKMQYFREFKGLDELVSYIAQTRVYIERDALPTYSLNVVKNLPNALKFSRQVRSFDYRNGLLMAMDKSAFPANLLEGRFRHGLLFQVPDTTDKKHYRTNVLRTIVANAYNLVFGGNWIRISDNVQANGDIKAVEILNQHAKILYTQGSGPDVVRLPMIPMSSTSKKILIFGGRYNSWAFIADNREEYKSRIFDLFRAYMIRYPQHDFLYKPHPLERGSEFEEMQKLFGNRIANVGIELNAEFFLLKNTDISKCISIGSTSVRSAFDMGFNGQVLYQALGFPSGTADAFDDVFRNMPTEFFVRNKEDVGRDCIGRTVGNLKPVCEVLDRFEQGRSLTA